MKPVDFEPHVNLDIELPILSPGVGKLEPPVDYDLQAKKDQAVKWYRLLDPRERMDFWLCALLIIHFVFFH